MSDDPTELIREIASEHGVALDRGDPILILHTATRKILQDALNQSQKATSESLAQHRSELELAATKWEADSKRIVSQLVQEARLTIATSVAEEMDRASRTASAQLAKSFAAHATTLDRSMLVSALAAVIIVLASAVAVLCRCG